MMFDQRLFIEKNRLKRTIATFFLVTCLGIYQIAICSEQVNTEAEIKAIEQDIEHTKKLLESINTERASVHDQMKKNDLIIQQLNRDISQLETRIKERKDTIKKFQSRHQKLMAMTELQREHAVKSLQSIYKTMGENRIKLLLNQENAENISRQLVYFKYVEEAQLKAIRKYESTVSELKSVEDAQAALILKLNQEKRDVNKKKQSLLNKQVERKKLLSELSARYQKGGQELKQLKLEREKLNNILANIVSRQLGGANTFKKRKGHLLWPVTGKMLFKFKDVNPETGMHWQGLFIATESGADVHAVHDGWVVFADWFNRYGLLVIVDHGDNFLTLYAHNNTILKQAGDSVLAGEPLALSGQSGGQQMTGVYFEVRLNGIPQNPLTWLERQQ